MYDHHHKQFSASLFYGLYSNKWEKRHNVVITLVTHFIAEPCLFSCCFSHLDVIRDVEQTHDNIQSIC